MAHPVDSILDGKHGNESTGAPIDLTDDLQRVLNLPQRDADSIAVLIAEPLSKRLRRPGGTMALLPLQALALAEAHDLGGLLALLPVGAGKTLITYLLPVLLGAVNPILLVPASLDKKVPGLDIQTTSKTRRDFAKLGKHWVGHANYTIISYELISRRPKLLDELDPDVIICDEADTLKNTKVACTRRVRRYLRDRSRAGKPITFYALSGTLTNRSFKDWWHLQQWALPPQLHPLPYSYPIVESWCAALDEKLEKRRDPGELVRLLEDVPEETFDPEKNDTLSKIRTAFGYRLRRIPGVIGSAEGSQCNASLRIECTDIHIPVIDNALAEMRRTWCTPGGEEFSEASALWRHAREIANGFYYRWDPPPPLWWLEPRREFHAFIRAILGASHTLDTMKQVVDAHPTDQRVIDWYAIKDGFKPNNVPVWFCNNVIADAAQWAHVNNGLVWVEHTAVGQRLEEFYGLPYFSEGGLDSSGRYIEDHNGPAALSSIACRRGLNLQYKWSNNRILNAYPVGKYYEQLCGRTHRFGQPAAVVYFSMIFTAQEQRDGFNQAVRDAHYRQEMEDQKQKLCLADYL